MIWFGKIAFLDMYAHLTYMLLPETKGAKMRSVVDMTTDIDEKSTERMNFRVKPRIKQTIQRAAALSGMDDSVFTTNAAYRAALETINSHERTTLAPVDHAAFFAAMDNPPEPTDALKDAAKSHKERVVQN